MRDVTFLFQRLALAAVLFFALAATCTATTTLQVITPGTGESDGYPVWKTEYHVFSPDSLNFGWTTDDVGATGATWTVVTVLPNQNWPIFVASGTLAEVPAAGHFSQFTLTFLPLQPPTPDQLYAVYIMTQGPNSTGAGPVKITYGKAPPSPVVDFSNLGKPYVEPGHPKHQFVRYDPLTLTKPGKLVIAYFNDTATPTAAVEVKARDYNFVVNAGAPILVPILNPSCRTLKTFVLTPQFATDQNQKDLHVPGDWKQRFTKGIRVQFTSTKVGETFEQVDGALFNWSQPAKSVQLPIAPGTNACV